MLVKKPPYSCQRGRYIYRCKKRYIHHDYSSNNPNDIISDVLPDSVDVKPPSIAEKAVRKLKIAGAVLLDILDF